MSTSSRSRSEVSADRQLSRWGGMAGLAGGILFVGSAAVIGAMGLPDASDVETLTDFADIEAGRIAEHFLYLGALMLFALHVLILHQLLPRGSSARFAVRSSRRRVRIRHHGGVIDAARVDIATRRSVHRIDTPPEDLPAIEYAWHGAQSVFDTMLATGVLLVPIGIVLIGIAMRSATAFGPRLAWAAITPAPSESSARSSRLSIPVRRSRLPVLAIVVFHSSPVGGRSHWATG